jgi:hypothetical protein
MAGVILMVRDRDQLAEGIMRLDDDDDRNAVIGSFVKYTEISDLSDWSKAVARHGPSIAAILRLCPAWPVDSAFLYPDGNAEVADEYGKWLNDLFDRSRLPSSDDEILSLMMFVQAAGPNIRERMAKNPTFKTAFRPQIWPAFSEGVKSAATEHGTRVPWELFTDCDAVWSLLQRPDGKALFATSGQFAADLLYGSNAVVLELREKAAQLFLLGNQDLLSSAFSSDWSQNARFVRLMLERNLTDDQLLGCCQRLLSSDGPQGQLNTWNEMSDNALAEDIGPPPGGVKTIIPGYAIYYAGKKLAQGRSVGWMDAVGIVGDVATLATLGTASVATGGVKEVAKEAAEEAAKKTASAAIRQKIRKEAVQDLAKITTRELAEQAGEKEVLSFAAHHALRVLPKKMQEQFLKSSILDVTDLVKSCFQMSNRLGIGRESFKKITSLDARVFMQKDAKVFISIPASLAGRCPSGAFLNATALNGVIDGTASSRPVQAAATVVIRFAKDENERWRKHLACWWATHATAGFKPIPQP